MKTVLVICGGVSAEHEVSLISARNILAALDLQQFIPVLVIISREGTWYLQADLNILTNLRECSDQESIGQVCTLIHNQGQTYLLPLAAKPILIDLAFPIVHGPMGEDGSLQGFFEIMNLPYVGSGVCASSLGMNKVLQRQLWALEKIPHVPFISFTQEKPPLDYLQVSTALNSAILFVKPAVMGSSVGVYKVRSSDEYQYALSQAFRYSNTVVVEKFVQGREIECAVLGNRQAQTSCLAEIHPTHEFYSYEAKYLDPQGAYFTIPAILSPALTENIQGLALAAYQALGCQGLARVDFFLSADDEIYINEINTLPGFTTISMYPKMWEVSGLAYSELITRLINLAFETHAAKQNICLVPDALMTNEVVEQKG